MKTSIGDVAIHSGNPPGGNPYRGNGRNRWSHTKDDPTTSLFGDDRVAALIAYRDGDLDGTAGLTYWHAPVSGGARPITSPDDIDWRGMS